MNKSSRSPKFSLLGSISCSSRACLHYHGRYRWNVRGISPAAAILNFRNCSQFCGTTIAALTNLCVIVLEQTLQWKQNQRSDNSFTAAHQQPLLPCTYWHAGNSNGDHKRVELAAKYMVRLEGLMHLNCNRTTKFAIVPRLRLLSSLSACLEILNLNANSNRYLYK